MPRMALVLSHDTQGERPDTMSRLADALVPFFDEVRWAIVSGVGHGGSAPSPSDLGPTGRVRRMHLRLPQVRATGGALLSRLTALAVDVFAELPQAALDNALQDAALVVVQSGPLAALIDRFRRQAPRAELVYFATTRLLPSDVHPRVRIRLERDAVLIDRAITTVRALVPDLAMFGARARFVPAGQEMPDGDGADPTCYSGSNAVVLDVRSLDASVVQIAAATWPATRFHLLGAQPSQRFPENVVFHGALAPEQALRLLQYADLALLPDASDPPDIVEASAALDHLIDFGLPVVCPVALAQDERLRFGYEKGRSASVRSALRLALQARQEPRRSALPSWRGVALCVLGQDQDERQTRDEVRFEARYVG